MKIYPDYENHLNYPGYAGDEYPLWDYSKLCPNPRFVGGTSNYLCECDQPLKCKGVQQAVMSFYPHQFLDPAERTRVRTEMSNLYDDCLSDAIAEEGNSSWRWAARETAIDIVSDTKDKTINTCFAEYCQAVGRGEEAEIADFLPLYELEQNAKAVYSRAIAAASEER